MWMEKKSQGNIKNKKKKEIQLSHLRWFANGYLNQSVNCVEELVGQATRRQGRPIKTLGEKSSERYGRVRSYSEYGLEQSLEEN